MKRNEWRLLQLSYREISNCWKSWKQTKRRPPATWCERLYKYDYQIRVILIMWYPAISSSYTACQLRAHKSWRYFPLRVERFHRRSSGGMIEICHLFDRWMHRIIIFINAIYTIMPFFRLYSMDVSTSCAWLQVLSTQTCRLLCASRRVSILDAWIRRLERWRQLYLRLLNGAVIILSEVSLLAFLERWVRRRTNGYHSRQKERPSRKIETISLVCIVHSA